MIFNLVWLPARQTGSSTRTKVLLRTMLRDTTVCEDDLVKQALTGLTTGLGSGLKQEFTSQIDHRVGQQYLEMVIGDRVILRPREAGLRRYGDDTIVGLVHQWAAAGGRHDGADRNADLAPEDTPD